MKAFSTKTKLLPYQAQAVEKMKPIKVGALFMDMGTGKTRCAIELARLRCHKIDKVVWFCPVSLKITIREEIIKHTDCQDIYVFDGKTEECKIPSARWYVVGIESLSSSSRTVFAANELITSDTMVILDESTYIKGHRAKRTLRVTMLSEQAKYRNILTGEPITQGVVDLFAQMRFLSPKILGYRSFYSFAANHLEYSEDQPGRIIRAHNVEWIAAKIQPYVYQITKKECLNLPRKLFTYRYFEMTWEQAMQYHEAKNEILMNLEADDFESYTIFRLFGALQQIACGFWNRRSGERYGKYKRREIPNSRIQLLLDTICEVPPEEKIVIWAKYIYDIESIARALSSAYGDESVTVYHGALSELKRHEQLQRFREKARFFVATPSCGGHGLTLVEAKYVIYYSNSFKYAERVQSEDRCHRIGQRFPVTYIDLICSCSIDERIQEALYNKENVADRFRRKIEEMKNNKAQLKEWVKQL